MKTCVECGHDNVVGVFFCEDCGTPFYQSGGGGGSGAVTLQTIDANTRQLLRKNFEGTTLLSPEQDVLLHFPKNPEPVILPPLKQVVFGRSTKDHNTNPHFDLTEYGAYRYGVSRLHAVIQREEEQLVLVDLRSTNGTYLNGERLAPHESRIVRNGDQISFGKLLMYVYFQ
ncbi:MAG: FHA domain-containing protein [Chloroflexi bacterium]|nr:MAG: FHA domain-containing protein [Chloroflexota bacterium]